MDHIDSYFVNKRAKGGSSSSPHGYTGWSFIACFLDTLAFVQREVHLSPKPVINVNLNTNLQFWTSETWEEENIGNATYPALNNFIFLCKECCVCWMFHWRAPPVHLHTVKNLRNDLIIMVTIKNISDVTLIPLKLLVELKPSVTGKKSSGLPPTLNSRLPLLLFASISVCCRKNIWTMNMIEKSGLFKVPPATEEHFGECPLYNHHRILPHWAFLLHEELG